MDQVSQEGILRFAQNDVVIYSITLLGALGFFGWTMWRRIGAILPGPKEIRWDKIPQRLYGVLVYVFLQKKMFKDPVMGVVHTLIFWGFCVLTIGSVNFLIQGLAPDFYLPFTHNAFFETTFDVFNVLVIAAVLSALYRRLIVRPKRVLPTWDAILILLLILTLMVSDLLITTTYGVSWWTHAATLLIFLCYLPFSKHFHIITAVPDVYFRNLRPRGKMTTLDLEHAEHFGVDKVIHLHWKNKLDGYSCTECGRCTSVCPANATGKKLDPRRIVMNVRDHVVHKDHELTLHENSITAQELWACTTCAACLEACPILIEQLPIITDMRRNLVLMQGAMPEEAANAMRNIETQENPWGISAEAREKWIEVLEKDGIHVPRMSPDLPVEILFWVGCAGALDERNKKIIQSMCKILNHAGISFGVLGKSESCTGDPARRIGNEYLFQTLAKKNSDVLNQYQYEKILTICPHCFNTFKNEYTDFGLSDKPTVHHSVYLKELIAQGKIQIKSNTTDKVTMHDSCYMTRYNDVTQEPRDIIEKISGDNFIEMKRSKKENFCCGAGGGRMWMEEKEGTRVNLNRAQEAVDTRANVLLTECPFCMVMMEDGTKTIAAQSGAAKMAVHDLAEWVAMNLG